MGASIRTNNVLNDLCGEYLLCWKRKRLPSWYTAQWTAVAGQSATCTGLQRSVDPINDAKCLLAVIKLWFSFHCTAVDDRPKLFTTLIDRNEHRRAMVWDRKVTESGPAPTAVTAVDQGRRGDGDSRDDVNGAWAADTARSWNADWS